MPAARALPQQAARRLLHTAARREKEQLAARVPGHLIDLEAKLDVLDDFAFARLDQGYVVVLVTDCDVLAVWAPPAAATCQPCLSCHVQSAMAAAAVRTEC